MLRQPPALEQRLADLEARAQRIEDINAIKRLQRAYGYYLDEGRWDDAADLFADDASLEIGFDGVYRGRARIREYFRALGDGTQGLRARPAERTAAAHAGDHDAARRPAGQWHLAGGDHAPASSDAMPTGAKGPTKTST